MSAVRLRSLESRRVPMRDDGVQHVRLYVDITGLLAPFAERDLHAPAVQFGLQLIRRLLDERTSNLHFATLRSTQGSFGELDTSVTEALDAISRSDGETLSTEAAELFEGLAPAELPPVEFRTTDLLISVGQAWRVAEHARAPRFIAAKWLLLVSGIAAALDDEGPVDPATSERWWMLRAGLSAHSVVCASRDDAAAVSNLFDSFLAPRAVNVLVLQSTPPGSEATGSPSPERGVDHLELMDLPPMEILGPDENGAFSRAYDAASVHTFLKGCSSARALPLQGRVTMPVGTAIEFTPPGMYRSMTEAAIAERLLDVGGWSDLGPHGVTLTGDGDIRLPIGGALAEGEYRFYIEFDRTRLHDVGIRLFIDGIEHVSGLAPLARSNKYIAPVRFWLASESRELILSFENKGGERIGICSLMLHRTEDLATRLAYLEARLPQFEKFIGPMPDQPYAVEEL